MSDKWEVGDVAMCNARGNGSWINSTGRESSGPTWGEPCTVTGIIREEDGLGLLLKEYPSELGYAAQFFIKIPPYKKTKDDEEVIDLMTKKPAHV